MTHREKHIKAVSLAENFGPPISPPITILLTVKMKKHMMDVIRNNMTENASDPSGTIET